MLKFLNIFLVFSVALSFAYEAISLTLTEAKIMALEKNYDITVWKFGVDSARGDYKSKKGVYDPVLSFGGSYSDIKSPTANAITEETEISSQILSFGTELSGKLPTGTSYKIFDLDVKKTESPYSLNSLDPFWEASLGFSVGQELLRGLGLDQDRLSVVLSRKDKDISEHEFERVVAETLFGVEKDYWAAVAAGRDLDLEKKSYELAVDLEERTRAKIEAGVLPRVALTQARSETAARKVRMINAENAFNAAMDVIKNRLVIPFTETIELQDSLDSELLPFEPLQESDAVENAFEKRPEIRAIQEEVKKTETLKSYHSRQRLPSLSVEAKLEYLGVGGKENPGRLVFGGSDDQPVTRYTDPSDAYKAIRDRDFPGWTVAATLSYPIFGRTARGAYAKARADHDRSLINYRKRQDMVRLEVRNALREVKVSQKRTDAAKLSVELAQEVLRNEEEKYKIGLSTTREILEAQRDLLNAEAGLTTALASYRVALSDLQRSQGTIIESNSFIIDNSDASSYLRRDFSKKTNKEN